MADHAKHAHVSSGPPAEGAKPGRARRRVLLVTFAAAAVVVAAIVAGALLWGNGPERELETVTLHGVEYTTNMRMDEHGGYAYLYVPVNADAGEVVLETADEGDNERIRGFLDGLDTLIPGEHVLELSGSNLHVIVDGMEE